MHLTKFSHACVRLDDGDRTLVIDPGAFSEVEQALDGADAVLITHEHVDHIDAGRLGAALRADPRLQVWAPSGVAASLAEFGEQIVTVEGDSEPFEAASFSVRPFGGQHALVHSAIPIVWNVGYLIDDTLFHPGDSFVVPNAPVATLLLPTNAPWSKAAEVIDFAVSVRAAQTFQIHDSLINDGYANLVEGMVSRIAGPFGVQFRHLGVAESVTL